MKHILFILALASCTTHKEKASLSDRKEQIEEQILVAKSGLNALADPQTGWPSVNDCDGTLWAGLACAGGYPVKIDLAEYYPGEIHRRPAPSCWNHADQVNGSASTVSNDMLLGYEWCRWQQKDLGAFQRLADYGESHNWIMGQPSHEVGRVVMKPNMLGILGRAILALSNGADKRSYRHTPMLFLPASQDYVRHLQALEIVLYGEITELRREEQLAKTDISGAMQDTLEELVEAEPLNAGFATALGIYTGDMSRAVDLFLDPETPIPSYCRGDKADAFAFAERLFWLTKAHQRMQ